MFNEEDYVFFFFYPATAYFQNSSRSLMRPYYSTLCHHLESPSALIRARVLMEQPGFRAAVGPQNLSLVPLNNEVECVPSVLIKTHGHSSI